MKFEKTLQKRTGLLTLLLLIFISACETEIDLLSEEGDTTVIFGMLDPGSDEQLFKITKSFIGEADAKVLAQNPNNYNFKDGDMTVTLQGKLNGKDQGPMYVAEYVDDEYPKSSTGADGEPGVFATEPNVVYRFNTATDPLDPNLRYFLTVVNNNTGEELSSETEVIEDFNRSTTISTPITTNLKFALGTNVYNELKFELYSPQDARRIELYLIVRYRTTDLVGVGDTTAINSFEIFLGEAVTPDEASKGTQQLTVIFNGERYYQALNREFGKDKNRKYLLEPMYIKANAAGEDLNTYIEVNQPSVGIVQEKPEFTNIKNGIGIFSSRSIKVFDRIGDEYYLENTSTAQQVRSGEYTLGDGIIVCHVERNGDPGSFTCP